MALTIPNDPILIHFDESGYDNKKAEFETIATALQQAVTAYNTLGLADLATSDLSNLFLKTEELIFDKMTDGEPVSIAGLQVDKVKAMEILMKPSGYENLLATIESLKASLQNGPYNGIRIQLTKAFIETNYELDEGNIVFKSSANTALENTFKHYATTPLAKKMYVLAQAILEGIDDLGLNDGFKTIPDKYNPFKHVFAQDYNTNMAIDWKAINKYNETGRTSLAL